MTERRSFVTAAVVVALAVGLLVATPGLAGFKSGQYVGTTSQAHNVGLKVPRNKNKVQIVYFEFLNTGCSNVTQTAGVSTKLKPSGKFNLDPADPVFANGYIKGKFDGKQASGTAEFPSRCPGLIEWTAEKD